MNKKILILLFLFSRSETFFITLICFLCGYCVGYYFYELLRPKKSAEDILQFFSSYNRKHGFVNSYTKKFEYKRLLAFRGRFMQRKSLFRKFKKKIEEVITSSNCSFYFGKRIMTFSLEVAVTPTAEIARKILRNVDEVVDAYFAKTKILCEIAWCSSYILDKRVCQSVICLNVLG